MPNSTAPDHSPWSRQRLLTTLASVAVLIVAVGLAWWTAGGNDDAKTASTPSAHSVVAPGSASTSTSSRSAGAKTTSGKRQTPKPSSKPAQNVPARVQKTLALIDAGRWPADADSPGTRGGDRFGNYENRLPATGPDGRRRTFQEWDVNPKQPGRGRDAERIITANDGSAWYTLDHYQTFIQIRGPSR
ncbi:MAG: ribonuclease domain-containing protein [Gordonia sp. (in: high G+C Gram-positive bacteria)]